MHRREHRTNIPFLVRIHREVLHVFDRKDSQFWTGSVVVAVSFLLDAVVVIC